MLDAVWVQAWSWRPASCPAPAQKRSLEVLSSCEGPALRRSAAPVPAKPAGHEGISWAETFNSLGLGSSAGWLVLSLRNQKKPDKICPYFLYKS